MTVDDVTGETASRAYDRTLGEMMDLVDRWNDERAKEVASGIETRLLTLYQIARSEGRARGLYQGEVFRLNNTAMGLVRRLRLVPGFPEGRPEVVRQLCQEGLDCAVDLQIALFGDVSSVDEV